MNASCGFQCHAYGYFNSTSKGWSFTSTIYSIIKDLVHVLSCQTMKNNKNNERFFHLTGVKLCYSYHEQGILRNRVEKADVKRWQRRMFMS